MVTLVQGVATIKMRIPPAETTGSLAKDRSTYHQAGKLKDADLWLVLSQPK